MSGITTTGQKRLVLISGRAHPLLAQEIAESLGSELIPGAVSAPTTDNLGADGRMLPSDVLAARFAALGIRPETPVGVYCGSGVTAAHEALALVTAGFPMPALYAGSYSAWSNDPERPVADGADSGNR